MSAVIAKVHHQEQNEQHHHRIERHLVRRNHHDDANEHNPEQADGVYPLAPPPEVPRPEVFWQEAPLRLCAELEVYRDAVRDVQANHADGRQERDGRICGVRIDLFDHVVHQRKQKG